MSLLIKWEQANDYSIKNLGPLAIGFAMIVLALAMYQAIKQIGGNLAGAGLTLADTKDFIKLPNQQRLS